MSWRELVNVNVLSLASKRRMLELLKEKLGLENACEALGLSKTTLHSIYPVREKYQPMPRKSDRVPK
ncbi:MAG: hypothetical protein QW369_00460 [Desulfurococcaceae archaeon]